MSTLTIGLKPPLPRSLYLETTVKTGFLCSYVPDVRFPVDWLF